MTFHESLRRWRDSVKDRPTGQVISGLASPEDGNAGVWSLFFLGDGLRPGEIRAPSLAELATRATAAVTALYAEHPSICGARFDLLIFPDEYDNGPDLQITETPTGLIAGIARPGSSESTGPCVHGTTLDDLVAAVIRLGPTIRLDPPATSDAVLTWSRPVRPALLGLPSLLKE